MFGFIAEILSLLLDISAFSNACPVCGVKVKWKGANTAFRVGREVVCSCECAINRKAEDPKAEVMARDFLSYKWIPAREAFYVITIHKVDPEPDIDKVPGVFAFEKEVNAQRLLGTSDGKRVRSFDCVAKMLADGSWRQ